MAPTAGSGHNEHRTGKAWPSLHQIGLGRELLALDEGRREAETHLGKACVVVPLYMAARGRGDGGRLGMEVVVSG